MTVTLAGSVQCDSRDLVSALRAVRPHAGNSRADDLVSANHRIRLVIDRHHVNVCATNGATMALAQASIVADDRKNPEDADDGPFVVDLLPIVEVLPEPAADEAAVDVGALLGGPDVDEAADEPGDDGGAEEIPAGRLVHVDSRNLNEVEAWVEVGDDTTDTVRVQVFGTGPASHPAMGVRERGVLVWHLYRLAAA